jgi:hypothetical protein
MSQERRRKCRHCQSLFRPDPRNRRHQRFCSKPDCRRASKAASQRRWLSKPQNRDYFRGPEHLERVRAWRAAHPGYGRKPLQEGSALQEHSLAQVTDSIEKSATLTVDPLQELSRVQPLVLMGLIAHLTDATLQDDIARASRHFQQLAHDVLNPGATHGEQTTPSP